MFITSPIIVRSNSCKSRNIVASSKTIFTCFAAQCYTIGGSEFGLGKGGISTPAICLGLRCTI